MSDSLRFGCWQFDPALGELTGDDGTRVALEPQTARLLACFLAHDGELLSHEQLVEVVWSGRVVSDDAVRRGVSNLRQVLADCGLPKCIRTVHRRGYLAEFPQPAATAGLETAPAARRWSRLPLLSGSIALLLVLVTGLLLLRDEPAPASQLEVEYPIAVLPFLDLGPGEDDYFADGLAEELLGLLSRHPAFRVTSRGSSFRFRSGETDPKTVGKALGVDYLIEGSVRRENENLRIGVQLVDTGNGQQIWSGRYDRGFSELLRVQDDIARNVARALQVVLIQDTQTRPAPDLGREVHTDYLRARRLVAGGKTRELEQAINLLQGITASRPDFAPAWAGLAEAILLNTRNQSADTFESMGAVIEPLLERALAIDPKLGDAWVTRARLKRGDPRAMLANLERGLELNPSHAAGHALLAELYHMQLDRPDLALREIRQARALNPLEPRNHYAEAYLKLDQCDFDGARNLAKRALAVDADYLPALAMLSHVDALEGQLLRAHQRLQQAHEDDPRNQWLRNMLVASHLNLGDPAAAHQLNQPPFRVSSLYLQRYSGSIDSMARQMFAATRGELMFLGRYQQADFALAHSLHSGDPAPAREFLREKHGFDGKLPQALPASKLREALVMLLAWHAPEPSPTGRQAIEHARQRLSRELASLPACQVAPHALSLAYAAAVLGDTAEALTQLEVTARQAVVEPWIWWSVRSAPAFAGMREMPAYQSVMERLMAPLQSQRAILATGSLPATTAQTLAAADAVHPVDPARDHTSVGLHRDQAALVE